MTTSALKEQVQRLQECRDQQGVLLDEAVQKSAEANRNLAKCRYRYAQAAQDVSDALDRLDEERAS